MSIRAIKVNGRKVWQARVAFKGLRKSSIRPTKEEARQAEADLLADLRKQAGEASRAGQAPATLRKLLEFYKADMANRGKGDGSQERVEYTALAVEAVTPALLDKPVSAITDPDIFAFRNARAREGRRIVEFVDGEKRERRIPNKHSTINRDLRTLRAALKLARPDYRFPGKAFFKEDEMRVRWLRPEEELLVLEPMASPFREIAKLAALTLMRMTEIRHLTRHQVRLDQGVLELPTTKTEPRYVVLSEAARKILKGQMEAEIPACECSVADGKHQHVFPKPNGRPYSREQIGKAFRRASRAAGLRDFHFHDLRHHGATMALNRGFTAPIVMALGGWKTERMMRRYAAVTDQTLRAAAEAVSGAEAFARQRP
jgi:integrase